MQMLNIRLSTCVKSLIGKEGASALYKGVYSPLYSVPAINAIVFGAYEIAKRYISDGQEGDMTLSQGLD